MIQFNWAAAGIVIAILSHAGATIWWASKITNQMWNINGSLLRLDKELEKRDRQIAAVWNRVDDLNGRLSKVEGLVK